MCFESTHQQEPANTKININELAISRVPDSSNGSCISISWGHWVHGVTGFMGSLGSLWPFIFVLVVELEIHFHQLQASCTLQSMYDAYTASGKVKDRLRAVQTIYAHPNPQRF